MYIIHLYTSYYMCIDYKEIILARGVDSHGRSARRVCIKKRISFRRPVNANICCAKCTYIYILYKTYGIYV